jgi:hypothetical protein
MLNKQTLQDEIQGAIEDLLPNALREGLKTTFPRETEAGNNMADRFADVVTTLLAAPLAQSLAGAIDYHVRSASIYGTIITIGNKVTQTAAIASPSAVTNGKVPNTLGIM